MYALLNAEIECARSTNFSGQRILQDHELAVKTVSTSLRFSLEERIKAYFFDPLSEESSQKDLSVIAVPSTHLFGWNKTFPRKYSTKIYALSPETM